MRHALYKTCDTTACQVYGGAGVHVAEPVAGRAKAVELLYFPRTLTAEESLRNAPDAAEGKFKVPAILDEE